MRARACSADAGVPHAAAATGPDGADRRRSPARMRTMFKQRQRRRRLRWCRAGAEPQAANGALTAARCAGVGAIIGTTPTAVSRKGCSDRRRRWRRGHVGTSRTRPTPPGSLRGATDQAHFTRTPPPGPCRPRRMTSGTATTRATTRRASAGRVLRIPHVPDVPPVRRVLRNVCSSRLRHAIPL